MIKRKVQPKRKNKDNLIILFIALETLLFWHTSEQILGFPIFLYYIAIFLSIILLLIYFNKSIIKEWKNDITSKLIYTGVLLYMGILIFILPVQVIIICFKEDSEYIVKVEISSVKFTGNDKAYYYFNNKMYSFILDDDRLREYEQAYKDYYIILNTNKSLFGTLVLNSVDIVAK